MNARTHDLFALVCLTAAALFFLQQPITVLTLVVCLIANNIGALIPDIDQASNRLWDLLPAGEFIGEVAEKTVLGHRRFSHSILGFSVTYSILHTLLPRIFNLESIDIHLVVVSIMIGYGSHLLADSLTREGVPLLYPLRVNVGFPPYKKLRMKTGGWIEKFIFTPGIIILLIFLAAQNQDKLISIFQTLKK